MLIIEAANTIRGVASSATAISYVLEGMELVAGVESYKTLAQGQLGSSASVLYTAPASSQVFVKGVHLINTSGADVTGIKLFIGGAVAANQILGSMTLLAGGMAVMEENGWVFYNAAGGRRVRSL